MDVAPPAALSKKTEREGEREGERERRSAATFRFVSFMRINNHLFTVRGETAKEALSSESPLGSSSSVFLNFSPLERRSKSGAFFPPSFQLRERDPVRARAPLCVCECVCLLKGVCLCVCVRACVQSSRGQTQSLSTFNNNRTKKKKSGWNL